MTKKSMEIQSETLCPARNVRNSMRRVLRCVMEVSAAYMNMVRKPAKTRWEQREEEERRRKLEERRREVESRRELEALILEADVYVQFDKDPKAFRAAFRHYSQTALSICEELARRGIVAETPQQKKNLNYIKFQAQFEMASGLAALDKMPVPGHRQAVEALYQSNSKETELNSALETLTVPEFYDAVQKMAETVRPLSEVFERHDAGFSYLDEKPQEIDTSEVESRFHKALDHLRGSSDGLFVSDAALTDFWRGQKATPAFFEHQAQELFDDLRKPGVDIEDIQKTAQICLRSLEGQSDRLLKYAASSAASFMMRPSELQAKAEDAAETLLDSYVLDVRKSNEVFDAATRESRTKRQLTTAAQSLEFAKQRFQTLLTAVEPRLTHQRNRRFS